MSTASTSRVLFSLFLAAAVIVDSSCGRAEDGTPASNEREIALIKHIDQLEARIQSLEKRLETPNSVRRDDLRKVTARGAAAATAPPAAASQDAPADGGGNTGGSSTPAALSQPEDADALRDLQVIRDQAVTVKSGGLDVSAQLRYIRANGTLSFSRGAVAAGTVRYGVFSGAELSVTVPYFYGHRETQIGPGQLEKDTIWSIGDVSAQVTGTIFKETLTLPGVFGYVGLVAPTGPNPYIPLDAIGAVSNPIDPFKFYQSSGHFANIVGLTFVKTVEPVVLFGGVSYAHLWKRGFAGYVIEPGDRFGWNFGFGFSVSERTTLGASVQGGIGRDIWVNGVQYSGARAESLALVLSLTQRLAPGLYLEPTVAVGMTSDVPSATVAFAVRKTIF